MIVKCPRCGRLLTALNGEPDIECNCHLYCDDGDKPSDCTVTWPYEWNGQLGGFTGLHTGAVDESDRKHEAMGYCSTHSKYYYKDKVVIDLDWEKYFSHRAPRELRMSNGEY